MFHKTNLGSFGENLPCDLNGYVAERGDKYEDFTFDRGCLRTDEDREWHRDEWFPEWVEQCVEATKKAEAAAEEWRKS